jgi:hypothetical protein
MNETDINDTRIIADFKNITFSGFQKSKVKLELIKNIRNNKIEQSCYWSIELLCAGHFIDLWEIIILITSKYIHIGNPKLSIYLALRYENFKDILVNGYIDNEIKLRNNPKIRKLFAEIICILCLSPKKPSLETIKIDKHEYDITLLTDKLKADNVDYLKNFFREDDPKQLFIPINEFSYNLNKKNIMNASYWLEWLLQFDNICKNNKINLICETRENIPVAFEYQKDIIWLIWDAIFNEIEKREKDKKILKRIMHSLLNLFTIKYKFNCKKKRKNILYFAISLLTEYVNFNIKINNSENYITSIINKINTLYKEIKKNEIAPSTDYLFKNIKEDNLDKSISKIEMMNNLLNVNSDNEDINNSDSN